MATSIAPSLDPDGASNPPGGGLAPPAPVARSSIHRSTRCSPPSLLEAACPARRVHHGGGANRECPIPSRHARARAQVGSAFRRGVDRTLGRGVCAVASPGRPGCSTPAPDGSAKVISRTPVLRPESIGGRRWSRMPTPRCAGDLSPVQGRNLQRCRVTS